MYQKIDNTTDVLHVPTGAVVLATNPAYIDWVESGQTPANSSQSAERAEVWEAIKAHRDAVKSSGVKVGQHWYHSDANSRIQQMGLVMMGANLPAGLQWKTMSGDFVTMTPSLAGQIFQATAARDAVVFGVAEAHRAALATAQDPAAYDWSGGWPETPSIAP